MVLPGGVEGWRTDSLSFRLSETVPNAWSAATARCLGGKSIGGRDLERAAAATLGYPYLLQLVGYYLLEFAGSATSITSDAVELAIRASRQALEDAVFAPCLAPLSKRDEEFVRAMAVDCGASAVSEVAKRLGVSASSAQQTRARLIGHGVITAPRVGAVELAVPYLAEFLRGEL